MKEWRIKDYEGKENSLIKRLLYTRGVKTDEEIYEFLHPLEMKLTHPKAFCDMGYDFDMILITVRNHGYQIDITNQLLSSGQPTFLQNFQIFRGGCKLFYPRQRKRRAWI